MTTPFRSLSAGSCSHSRSPRSHLTIPSPSVAKLPRRRLDASEGFGSRIAQHASWNRTFSELGSACERLGIVQFLMVASGDRIICTAVTRHSRWSNALENDMASLWKCPIKSRDVANGVEGYIRMMQSQDTAASMRRVPALSDKFARRLHCDEMWRRAKFKVL